jgi:hypothetical protein
LNRRGPGHFVAVLTDRERRVLDEITADVEQSDPRLAAYLAGRRLILGRWWLRGRGIVAAAAIPFGLALTVATFTISPWLGFLGVAIAFWGCNVHATGCATVSQRAFVNASDAYERHRQRRRG